MITKALAHTGGRRIEAATGAAALAHLKAQAALAKAIASSIKAPLSEVTDRVSQLADDRRKLERELGWLRRRSRRLLWLNPLLRFDGYAPLARGAAVLHRHAHGMLAVHNVSKLEDLASSLAALMKA